MTYPVVGGEHKRYDGVMRSRKAWYIRWESVGGHAHVAQPFVALLPSRTGAKHIRRLLEVLYAEHSYTATEQLRQFSRATPAPCRVENPIWWPAPTGPGSAPSEREMVIGHNPHLVATLVMNVRITTDAAGGETVRYDELPTPPWVEAARQGR